jgi:hypothetical protein
MMEVLVRISCPCPPSVRLECSTCTGLGYFDKWIPYDLLPEVKGIILNRRVNPHWPLS